MWSQQVADVSISKTWQQNDTIYDFKGKFTTDRASKPGLSSILLDW